MVFKRSWRRNAYPSGSPWNTETFVSGGIGVVGAVAISLVLLGSRDALVVILSGLVGLFGSLVIPTTRTLRGMKEARAEAYTEQLKPLVDEFDARIEDLTKTVAKLESIGKSSQEFQRLDEMAKRDVRQRLEQLSGPFGVAVDRAVSALRHQQMLLGDLSHSFRVVGHLLGPPIEKLLEAQREFQDALASGSDSRGPFLLAYKRYQDAFRLVGSAQHTYPGRFTQMHHDYCQQFNQVFVDALGQALAISELTDVREYIRLYRPGSDMILFAVNFV
jgi:hypothetical protein